MTVLLVEDDAIILEGLKFALGQEGYEVLTAATVAQAKRLIEDGASIDFYLLDLMLPDGDGCSLCSEIRRESSAPILFLTARDDEVSTVRALEQGADDYIAKPFRIRELLARMKAIRRRTALREEGGSAEQGEHRDSRKSNFDQSSTNKNDQIGASDTQRVTVGEMCVDLRMGRVYHGEREVVLTAMEYRLLLVFLRHRGQTLSRKQILDGIWDASGDFVNDNTLSVYIKRLRAKLGDTPDGTLIRTVRGIGYRLE